MRSQPLVLSRSDGVKLGLIEIKGNTLLPVPSVPKGDGMMCQFGSRAKEDSGIANWSNAPTTPQDIPAQELASVASGPPSSVDSVASRCRDVEMKYRCSCCQKEARCKRRRPV